MINDEWLIIWKCANLKMCQFENEAISNNLNKIRDDYRWGIITDKYLEVFEKILTLKKQKKNIDADLRWLIMICSMLISACP